MIKYKKKHYINKASKKDIRFLFNSYNRSIVERLSNTRKIIKYENHKNWFLKVLNSKNCIIYILNLNHYKIGFIKINILKFKLCNISIFLKKEFRTKNLGSLYLNKVLKMIKNKLKIYSVYAEVKKNNKLSFNFFTKNQFKLINYSNKFRSMFNRNNYILKKKLK